MFFIIIFKTIVIVNQQQTYQMVSPFPLKLDAEKDTYYFLLLFSIVLEVLEMQ